jgi:hypothetical protein
MSNKLRSVNTRFWDDPFIEGLTVNEKLLFLYLLTNTQTNILGIYEISLKRISYDTGIKQETIIKAFESFAIVQKAYYLNNYIILPNFLKNQKLNSNMKIGAAKIFNELPMSIKNNILGNDLDKLSNDSKGFEMVLNALLKYEIEIEKEIKKEEIEKEGNSKEDVSKIIIDKIYSAYPSKCPIQNRSTSKGSKDKEKITKLLKTISEDKLILTINTYIEDCKKSQTYVKNFSSFLNNLPDITEQSKTEEPTPEPFDKKKVNDLWN